MTATGQRCSWASTRSSRARAAPDARAGSPPADPDRVVPRTTTLTGADGVFNFTAPANSLTVITLPPQASAPATVSGTVPATLSLTLGPAASFGAFTPGVAH